MHLTEDEIRESIALYLGNDSKALHIAWNLTIPQCVNLCAYENLIKPVTKKSQKAALNVIRQAAVNLQDTGTYHGRAQE